MRKENNERKRGKKKGEELKRRRRRRRGIRDGYVREEERKGKVNRIGKENEGKVRKGKISEGRLRGRDKGKEDEIDKKR